MSRKKCCSSGHRERGHCKHLQPGGVPPPIYLLDPTVIGGNCLPVLPTPYLSGVLSPAGLYSRPPPSYHPTGGVSGGPVPQIQVLQPPVPSAVQPQSPAPAGSERHSQPAPPARPRPRRPEEYRLVRTSSAERRRRTTKGRLYLVDSESQQNVLLPHHETLAFQSAISAESELTRKTQKRRSFPYRLTEVENYGFFDRSPRAAKTTAPPGGRKTKPPPQITSSSERTDSSSAESGKHKTGVTTSSAEDICKHNRLFRRGPSTDPEHRHHRKSTIKKKPPKPPPAPPDRPDQSPGDGLPGRKSSKKDEDKSKDKKRSSVKEKKKKSKERISSNESIHDDLTRELLIQNRETQRRLLDMCDMIKELKDCICPSKPGHGEGAPTSHESYRESFPQHQMEGEDDFLPRESWHTAPPTDLEEQEIQMEPSPGDTVMEEIFGRPCRCHLIGSGSGGPESSMGRGGNTEESPQDQDSFLPPEPEEPEEAASFLRSSSGQTKLSSRYNSTEAGDRVFLHSSATGMKAKPAEESRGLPTDEEEAMRRSHHQIESVEKCRLYRELGIRSPASVAADVAQIKEWLLKQPHLPRIRSEWLWVGVEEWLESLLLQCKNSVQRTKEALDLYFSSKVTIPEVFSRRDPTSVGFKLSCRVFQVGLSPGVNSAGERLLVFSHSQPTAEDFDPTYLMMRVTMIQDILLLENIHQLGLHVVVDFRNVCFAQLARYNLALTKRVHDTAMKSMPHRIRGIHLVYPSALVEGSVLLLKKILGKKLQDRIVVHREPGELVKLLGAGVVPADLGGEAPSIALISKLWEEKCISYRQWFLASECIRSDESKRCSVESSASSSGSSSGGSTAAGDFGYQGSFRKIEVD